MKELVRCVSFACCEVGMDTGRGSVRMPVEKARELVQPLV